MSNVPINYEDEYLKLNPIEKTRYSIESFKNLMRYKIDIIPNYFEEPQISKVLRFNKENIESKQKIEWSTSNLGLIVYIHGLNGTYKTIGNQIDKIIRNRENIENKENKENIEILLSELDQNNFKAEELSDKLSEVILDYINLNPGKKIVLISMSNGCRIASMIECKLRNVDVNIRLFCFCGAYNGTILINSFQEPFKFLNLHNFVDELSKDLDVNKKLIEKVKSKLSIGSRFYDFYVVGGDVCIPNFNDCYIEIEEDHNMKVLYHQMYLEYEHISLIWYLIEDIIEISINYLKN